MNRSMRVKRAVTVVLLAAVMAGCENAIGVEGPMPVVGIYHLQAIKDAPLPWRLATGPSSSADIVAGNIELAAHMVFVRQTHHRHVNGTDTTYSTLIEHGTYTTAGGGAVMLRRRAVSGVVAAQVSGNELVASFAGCCEPYRYQRP